MTLKSLFASAAIFAATSLPASSDPGLIAQFGPSGAGKTTVIRVLLGSLSPKSISINAGQDGAVFADFGNRKIFVVDEKNKSVIDMGAMAEQYRASGFAKPKSGDLDQLNAAQDVLRKQVEDMLAKMPESQRDIARKALE